MQLIDSKQVKKDLKESLLQFSTRQKSMIEALIIHLGNVSEACKSIDLPRQNHYTWIEVNPEYKKAVNEISNIALDYVEQQLFKKITGIQALNSKGEVYEVQPSDTAIIFYLKCKGKARGYIERTEVDQNTNLNITFNEEKTYSEPISIPEDNIRTIKE